MLLSNLTNAFQLKYDPPASNSTLDEHSAKLLGFNVAEFKDMKDFVIQLFFKDPLLVSQTA